MAAFVKFGSMNIKHFDGEPENRDTFVDSLECAIDENDTLCDIQKMICSKNLIDVKAETLISNIKLANENSQGCLKLLKER